MSAIYVYDIGDGCRLECWAGTRKDMAAVVRICEITGAQTWDSLAAKVREHQGKHGCGDLTGKPYAFTRDELTEALTRIEVRPPSHGKVPAEWMADAIIGALDEIANRKPEESGS